MESYVKGKSFEQKVAAIVRRKADGGAARNKGSHANWNRRSDIFTNLPLHIEAKDHETLKPKEWFRQAEAAASYTQIPIVAFQMDEEVMAMLRLNDVLDLYAEIADLKVEVEDLRTPLIISTKPMDPEDMILSIKTIPANSLKVGQKIRFGRPKGNCKEGHIADEYGYCMQTKCKYSRGYRPPKKERGK